MGDLFNTPVPGTRLLNFVIEWLKLAREQKIAVAALEGSHDASAIQPSFIDVLAHTNLLVRLSPGQQAVAPGVSVFALPGMRGGTEIRNVKLESGPKDEPSLFLFHTALKEALPENLRDKISGLSIKELPKHWGAYVGAHLHWPYSFATKSGKPVVCSGPLLGSSIADLQIAQHKLLTLEWNGKQWRAKFDPFPESKNMGRVIVIPVKIPIHWNDIADAHSRQTQIMVTLRFSLRDARSSDVAVLQFHGKWPEPTFNPYPYQQVVCPPFGAVLSDISGVTGIKGDTEKQVSAEPGGIQLEKRLAQLSDKNVRTRQVVSLYQEMAQGAEVDETKGTFVKGRVTAGCRALEIPETTEGK